jgi:hypothetical protein
MLAPRPTAANLYSGRTGWMWMGCEPWGWLPVGPAMMPIEAIIDVSTLYLKVKGVHTVVWLCVCVVAGYSNSSEVVK